MCLYRGLSPAEAEFNYLNTARTLEFYGVEFHYARVSGKGLLWISCWVRLYYSVSEDFLMS